MASCRKIDEPMKSLGVKKVEPSSGGRLFNGKKARDQKQSSVEERGRETVKEERRRLGRHGCGPPGNDRTTHCDPSCEKATLG